MNRLIAAAFALCSLLALANAAAQGTGPIQIVVPAAPGGAPDVLARAFSEAMAQALGQSVIVVNREGAGNVIGVSAVAAAAPDGRTLGFSPVGAITTQTHVRKDLAYGIDSFDYLCQAYELHIALAVRAESGIRSLADLLAQARAQPGKLSIGTSGAGTVPHLSLALIEETTGVRFNHVPFKGDGPSMASLLGGHIDAGLYGIGVTAGRPVRSLAVLAPRRLGTHPDIPTAAESGAAVSKRGLGGLYAPRGLPPAVRTGLEKACAVAIDSSAYRTASEKLRIEPAYQPGTAFAEQIRKDYAEDGRLIAKLGLKE